MTSLVAYYDSRRPTNSCRKLLLQKTCGSCRGSIPTATSAQAPFVNSLGHHPAAAGIRLPKQKARDGPFGLRELFVLHAGNLVPGTQALNASLVLRALQITAVRITHITLAAPGRGLPMLVFVVRRRSRKLQLRMCLEFELVVEDAAWHARRILGKSDRNGGKQGTRSCCCGTDIKHEFHGRLARWTRV